MALKLNALALPFAVSAAISVVVALLIFQRQNVKGGVALALLMMEFGLWSAANAVRFALIHPAAQLPWLRLAHSVLVPAPLTLLVFMAQLTDADRWLNNFNLFLLAVEPFATIFVLATNEAHWLYFSSVRTVNLGGLRLLAWDGGPWFWFNTACSYLFVLAASLILVRAVLRAGPYIRVQLLTVLAGCLLPWSVNLYALLTPQTARTMEVTPLAAAASGLIFAYALFRQRLLDIAPVARSLLFEKLGDAVLVLDMTGRVVDFNRAARLLLGLRAGDYGRTLAEAAPHWSDLAKALDDATSEGHTELQGHLDPARYFDVTLIPLLDSRGRRNGSLVSVRDISRRRQAEMEVQRMNARLRRQVRKISTLHEELREQAIRDPLTGLFNRRYLDETLEREISRARRGGYSIGLILIDVDRFKLVNDTYGHKAGDRVLRRLGATIRQLVRLGDIPCRFGGEEFVIVMPQASLDTAYERAEEIRQRFAATRFFKVQDGVVPSLSLGIALYPNHGRTQEKVLHAADQAMYQAKAQGGDRAMRYDSRQKSAPVALKYRLR